MATPSASATKTPAFKPSAVQAGVIRNLAALGSTTDYRAIIAGGGNGMTISRLSDLGYIKIKPPGKKQPEKGYELTPSGKKLAAKL
jgi:hypothetical protein